MSNLLLLTDSYKASHSAQYPPGTEIVYSYFTCRSNKFSETVIFFGLQIFLKKYLEGIVVTESKIEEAKQIIKTHVGHFNEAGWRYILTNHNGKLPIKIMAVPEGTEMYTNECLFTMENTDPACFWLTNYLETLLVQVWGPTTIATNSRKLRHIILAAKTKSGKSENIDYSMHDFGVRGVSSMETAGMLGCAHLTQFKGTDNIPALVFARDYYNSPCAGFSIPASEHSTVTAWGDTPQSEDKAFRNMLKTYPTGNVAHVSDSYNIYQFITHILGAKSDRADGEKCTYDMICERNGTVVVRPDSGDPVKSTMNVLTMLGKVFGTIKNDKGYKLLPPYIRMIQGDGINRPMVIQIYHAMMENGWSADNIAFGSGGGLLQRFNRDTLNCAFKCSAIKRNGKWQDVYKSPVDAKNKKSLAGRLFVMQSGFRTKTIKDTGNNGAIPNVLKTVFQNGHIVLDYPFESIRASAQENNIFLRPKWEDLNAKSNHSVSELPVNKFYELDSTLTRQELYDVAIATKWV